MNRRHMIIAVAAIVIAFVVVGIAAFVVPVRPSVDGTYTEAASSVHAPPNAIASNGQLALRVNNVSDASDPTIANVWASLAPQARGAGVYYRELTPATGERNLIANVTVTNAQNTRVPFTYTNFFLVGRDGSTYYANYAVCDSSCSAAALKNRTLTDNFTANLYVLFSVPATIDPVKLVYASSPPIVVTLS